jgi:NAD-dependent protein deacetylase/lipoamidase
MPAAALAELIRERQPCVVLTGAGMSTESGIPDFRSPGGMWDGVDPFEVASIDAFRSDPLRVWRWYGSRIRRLLAAEPNRGHHALVALERAGLVRVVVTQNIDLLHTRAGSRDVVEVHGSIRSYECLVCGAREGLDAVLAQLEVRDAPVCTNCTAVLKPGVVMFGELLPADAIARAEELVGSAGLLLVVGSSLQVWPVASLPSDALAAGAALAIVNRDVTPYDEAADVLVAAAAGETLAAVQRELVGERTA